MLPHPLTAIESNYRIKVNFILEGPLARWKFCLLCLFVCLLTSKFSQTLACFTAIENNPNRDLPQKNVVASVWIKVQSDV